MTLGQKVHSNNVTYLSANILQVHWQGANLPMMCLLDWPIIAQKKSRNKKNKLINVKWLIIWKHADFLWWTFKDLSTTRHRFFYNKGIGPKILHFRSFQSHQCAPLKVTHQWIIHCWKLLVGLVDILHFLQNLLMSEALTLRLHFLLINPWIKFVKKPKSCCHKYQIKNLIKEIL